MKNYTLTFAANERNVVLNQFMRDTESLELIDMSTEFFSSGDGDPGHLELAITFKMVRNPLSNNKFGIAIKCETPMEICPPEDIPRNIEI